MSKTLIFRKQNDNFGSTEQQNYKPNFPGTVIFFEKKMIFSGIPDEN
jgi:hypothetical protein